MLQEEKKHFFDLLHAVYEIYGEECAEGAASLWLTTLQAYDPRKIAQAFVWHLRRITVGQYRPLPADIMREFEGAQ